MNENLVTLARHGKGHLPFKIKMLLSANPELAGKLDRRICQRLGWFPPTKRIIRKNCLIALKRIFNRNRGIFLLELAFNETYGTACGIARFCHHRKQRLADKFDMGVGEHRIVAHRWRHIVFARNVFGRQHGHDAHRRFNRVKIKRKDFAAGNGRAANRYMQRAFGFR